TSFSRDWSSDVCSSDLEPVLCFDGDSAGQRAAARAAERALPLLKPGFSLRFVTLPAKEDPDSLIRTQGSAAMRRLIEQAAPLVRSEERRVGKECSSRET